MKLVDHSAGMTTVANGARGTNAFSTRYLNRERSGRTGGPQCRMGGDAHRKLASRVWRYLEVCRIGISYVRDSKSFPNLDNCLMFMCCVDIHLNVKRSNSMAYLI